MNTAGVTVGGKQPQVWGLQALHPLETNLSTDLGLPEATAKH